MVLNMTLHHESVLCFPQGILSNLLGRLLAISPTRTSEQTCSTLLLFMRSVTHGRCELTLLQSQSRKGLRIDRSMSSEVQLATSVNQHRAKLRSSHMRNCEVSHLYSTVYYLWKDMGRSHCENTRRH